MLDEIKETTESVGKMADKLSNPKRSIVLLATLAAALLLYTVYEFRHDVFVYFIGNSFALSVVGVAFVFFLLTCGLVVLYNASEKRTLLSDSRTDQMIKAMEARLKDTMDNFSFALQRERELCDARIAPLERTISELQFIAYGRRLQRRHIDVDLAELDTASGELR